MKHKDLVRALIKAGCTLLREGGKHEVYISPSNQRPFTVPRHPEINENLAKAILKQAGIKKPNYPIGISE